MAPKLRDPRNLLLAALPAADRRRLLARCGVVDLVAGQTLIEPGEHIRHAFFPIDSYISLITPISAHEQLEVGLVGNEGMFGISLVLGVANSALRGLVQGSGSAWRVDAAAFRGELRTSVALRRGLNRYVYVSLSQLARTAACTRFHFVEARLARWLLMTRDRADSNSFDITQEFLAYMLGVRRAGVTRAAGALQRRKLIHYHRGSLVICDERGLEEAACSCYAISKETYARVLSA